MNRPVVHALIPAAGRGSRFGGTVLKQYLPLAGKPVLAHAIDAVNLYPEIAGVTVVIAEADPLFADALGTISDAVDTVSGGATRAESVMNGMRSIAQNHPATEWVLVHDAARPCLPRSCLCSLLKQGLQSRDGAILAVPVSDTVKRAGADGRIDETIDRDRLWQAQTPQLFPFRALYEALQAALAAGVAPTDEAGVMQRTGARPLLVMGSAANLKITRPEDVSMAETWLLANTPGAEP
jgi:2-C-methyl-D-erythritol 4-phosphate cytidylyltransferase